MSLRTDRPGGTADAEMQYMRTRVLIIDDNADQRTSLRLCLQMHGYVVEEAANGRLGLELQRRRPCDVVVTDLFMPEQDGIETISELRLEYPSVPIIAVSGVASRTGADFLRVAEALGANRTFRKPYAIEELIDAIRGFTEARPSGGGAPAGR